MARAWRWSSSGCRRHHLLPTADLDADLEGSLEDWRRFRRQKRTADIHWIDALYQAYLTGILSLIAVAVLSSMVGDAALDAGQLARVRAEGPGWIGVAAAFALALGLRSGSRGGPLALERVEVRHVLLAPVDRTTALRPPAIRQLRFLAFVGSVVGGIAGDIAAKRMTGPGIAWVATGALSGVTLVALFVGAALVAAGARLPRWIASLVGLALLALAVADGIDAIATSPTAPFGDLVLWPLRFHISGLLPVVVGLALVIAGLAGIGRLSLEAAERRSTLVGQLRFAATLQDLRTVIVLRRQLAMELPRVRPWVRLRVVGSGRLPFFVRGLRGFLRWPAARVARLALLGTVAGLCLRGVWSGTTPLIVLAGVAMFIAGLDTVEPLAQEVDHPTRRDSSPLEPSAIHLRHVPTGVVAQLLVAALAVAVAGAPGHGHVPADVGLLGLVPLALGGLGGALVSVLSGPPSAGGGWALVPPEAQGMRLAFRTAWPPAIATFGAVPVLFARDAIEAGRTGASGALPAAMLVVALFTVIGGWVRVRDDIGSWFRQQMEQANDNR
ncbi:MAG: hypothetical protein ABL966_04635 [Acidimicrobiales bacterium]